MTIERYKPNFYHNFDKRAESGTNTDELEQW